MINLFSLKIVLFELTIIFDVMIEPFSSDAGSDADVEVFRMVVGDGVHLGQVEADAAVQSWNSGLESCSRAVRNDRNVFRKT